MDALKSLLGSGGINLLTDECASAYLDNFDVLNVECAKATISKALGLAIIAGSILVKLPQILNMMKEIVKKMNLYTLDTLTSLFRLLPVWG